MAMRSRNPRNPTVMEPNVQMITQVMMATRSRNLLMMVARELTGNITSILCGDHGLRVRAHVVSGRMLFVNGIALMV